MRLYGKTLKEIFHALPFQYKAITVIGVFFIFYSFSYTYTVISKSFNKPKKPYEIRIMGIPEDFNSILDPSIAYDVNTSDLLMAYTVSQKGSPLRHVRLASTIKGTCESWIYKEKGFEGKSYSLLKTDAQTIFRDGVWRVETPSVVYDPDDEGKEWKLFAYKYFWSSSDEIGKAVEIAKHYGMVVYKYASDPDGEWSAEQWLFSPAPNYPPPPYQRMVKLHLNNLHSDLSDVTSYSRPSVVYKDGYLLMTLSAFTNKETPNRVIMIASPDHGQSWVYLGSPITEHDVSNVGNYTRLAGATLMQQGDNVYLSAVLGNESTRAVKTYIFEFDNMNKAKLKRKSNNNLEVINEIDYTQSVSGTLGGGFAAYTEACRKGGFFIAEQRTEDRNFNIFKSYNSPVREE